MKILNLKTLTLALLCFVSVQSVWADEVTVSTAQELTDALAAASKTSSNLTVITIGADFSGTSTTFKTADFTIASGTYVTLNLNGHTLTGGGYGSVFNNLGTLVIEDLTAKGDPAKGIYDKSSNPEGYQSGKITGGYATKYASDKTMSGANGGAVWNQGTLTMASGTITGNYARNGGAFGSGSTTTTSSYTVTGGLICNNTSCNQGGAIATWSTTDITVSNAAFISNTCVDSGGAIFTSKGNITVNSGTFTSNSADYGGAVFGGEAAPVTIKGGTFTENTATNSGGAVYSKLNLTVEAGTFTSNSAPYGGAVVGIASTIIKSSTFTENTATNSGGAVYSNGNITVEAGTFTSNSAPYGGAVFGATSTTITGGTYTGNYTSDSGYGAIYSYSGNLNISGNPIIKDNKIDNTANTANDIEQTVTLTGDLTSGADIRFTMSSGKVANNTSNYKINSGIAHSTDASYLVKTVAGDGAYLIKNDAISENDNIDLPHATAYTLASESPTVASVSYTRNVKNTFGTIMLPFVPTTDSNVKYFMIDDGAASEQTGVIKLTSVDTPVANTPYIFKYYGDIDNTNGTDVTFSAANTTLGSATPVANTSGNWTLTGTYSDVTKNGSGSTFYYVAAKNGTFYRAEGNTHFAPYRSWATYSGSGNAKSFTIMLDDETTGIATIENGEMQLNMGTIYDLQGRKVNTPQRGNIYIINGKKISY